MTANVVDSKWMRLALRLALKGRPHPNPPVGAVVVNGDAVLARGWHDGPGTPHAEHMALETCIGDAVGATLYVTLEPCCHTIGRDGGQRIPCWRRCVDAGITRVVIACEDIDPRTAGKGIQLARKAVHRLRADCDAIVVGVGTVIADDPELTVRNVTLHSGRQPRGVVFDRTLRMPLSARIARPGTVIVTTTAAPKALMTALQDKGCHILTLDADRYTVENILPLLADLGLGIVLLEAGGLLTGSFYRARCVDEVNWFLAPKLVGGGSAPVGLAGSPLATRMNGAIELTQMRMHRYGVDVLITGRPVWEGREAEI